MTSKQNPEIPDDLELEVGTKDEVLWNNVSDQAQRQLDAANDNIKIQSKVLELAEKMIALEKEKFK